MAKIATQWHLNGFLSRHPDEAAKPLRLAVRIHSGWIIYCCEEETHSCCAKKKFLVVGLWSHHAGSSSAKSARRLSSLCSEFGNFPNPIWWFGQKWIIAIGIREPNYFSPDSLVGVQLTCCSYPFELQPAQKLIHWSWLKNALSRLNSDKRTTKEAKFERAKTLNFVRPPLHLKTRRSLEGDSEPRELYSSDEFRLIFFFTQSIAQLVSLVWFDWFW